MLHYACERDAHACVKWMCEQPGVDVNVQDAQLRTPFLLACENRALGTVGVLIARSDVDLKAVTKQEQNALHQICATDDALELVRTLLDKGLDPAAISSDALTPLHVAIANDAVAIATLLIDRGAAAWSAGGGKRFQPLLPFALSKQSNGCASLLVERGAPLGAVDTEGRTVVHIAVKEGSPCLAAILARTTFTVDVDARDRAGRAALHYAVATGSAERTAVLLEHGADIDAEDGAGMTPLHVACCTGEAELAALLISKGSRTDATDRAGNSPLHWACQRGSEPCVQLLVSNGADLSAANDAGLTPLALTQSQEIAAAFQKAGGGSADADASSRKRSRDESAPPFVEAFIKAFNSGKADAMAELFAPAGSLDGGSGSVAVGKEAVRVKFAELHGGGGRFVASARHYSSSTLTASIEGRVSLGKHASGAAAKDTVAMITTDATGLITKAKLYISEHL